MKTYGVSIPITGTVYIEVTAKTEEDAIDKAFMSDLTLDNVESWDTHKHIVKGNVFYGEQNEVDIQEV